MAIGIDASVLYAPSAPPGLEGLSRSVAAALVGRRTAQPAAVGDRCPTATSQRTIRPPKDRRPRASRLLCRRIRRVLTPSAAAVLLRILRAARRETRSK